MYKNKFIKRRLISNLPASCLPLLCDASSLSVGRYSSMIDKIYFDEVISHPRYSTCTGYWVSIGWLLLLRDVFYPMRSHDWPDENWIGNM